ncbi:MAG: secretory protein [Candidatus Saccharibacteria bacterium]|nr:secretory protein [Candidatus Saccharibacteria bacterium]
MSKKHSLLGAGVILLLLMSVVFTRLPATLDNTMPSNPKATLSKQVTLGIVKITPKVVDVPVVSPPTATVTPPKRMAAPPVKVSPAIPVAPVTHYDSSYCPVDFSQAPDLASAAKIAQQVCLTSLPQVFAYLSPAPQAPPYQIIFDTNQYAAYVQYNQIHISIAYARSYPNGIASTVGHEITHLDQNYPASSPSWATEGIADFMRNKLGYTWDYFNCKPTERWTSGYGCTAKFLTFVSNRYDAQLVHNIHLAIKAGTYSDNIFVSETGKTAEALYADCRLSDCYGGGQ